MKWYKDTIYSGEEKARKPTNDIVNLGTKRFPIVVFRRRN